MDEFDNLITTMPWTCRFSDGCPVGWHTADYWVNEDGSYSIDNYADGDHDPCDKKDIPTGEEADNGWNEYAEYCAKTGLDPLDNYCPLYPLTRQGIWQVRFTKSILGAVFRGARRNSRGPWNLNPPEFVREYLLLEPVGTTEYFTYRGIDKDGSKIRELWGLVSTPMRTNASDGGRNALKFTCEIKEVIPPSDHAKQRAIKASARRDINSRKEAP